MGGGYLGSYRNTEGSSNASVPDSNIDDNARLLAKRYRLTSSGYFGSKGNGKKVRIINCTNPIDVAEYCYQTLGRGGVMKTALNSKGLKVHMSRLADGTLVTYRQITSSAGSPAVEIRLTGREHIVKEQKIHFVMEATLW